jgi:hypothetical protein
LPSREDDEERTKLQKELALTQKKCDLLFSRIEAKVGRLASTLKDKKLLKCAIVFRRSRE